MIVREIRMGGKLRKFECFPVVEKCEGCSNIAEVEGANYCNVYAKPDAMWTTDDCLGATHVDRKIVSVTDKKVNPLKASKKASRNR